MALDPIMIIGKEAETETTALWLCVFIFHDMPQKIVNGVLIPYSNLDTLDAVEAATFSFDDEEKAGFIEGTKAFVADRYLLRRGPTRDQQLSNRYRHVRERLLREQQSTTQIRRIALLPPGNGVRRG